MAIEIWLLILQPWNYCNSPSSFVSGYSSNSERINRNSRGLDAVWKVYIANHYHFYSTLFVYFIRMISKMNISLVNQFNAFPGSSSSSMSMGATMNSYGSYAGSSYGSAFGGSSFNTANANPANNEATRNLLMLDKVVKAFSSNNLMGTVEDLGRNYSIWYNNFLADEGHSPSGKKFHRSHFHNNNNNHKTLDNDYLIAMVLLKEHVSFLSNLLDCLDISNFFAISYLFTYLFHIHHSTSLSFPIAKLISRTTLELLA